MQKKAVFLDRDGVLNKAIIKQGKPYPPESREELIIMSDAYSALTKLSKAGYLLIAATNQPDVARGKTSKAWVNAVNQTLMTQLPLDDFRVCFHDDKDLCLCRKPLPGLLLDAASEHGIDLKDSFMIGDRWKDIEAGQRAGCKTIWLNHSYAEISPNPPPNYTAYTLTKAADWIIQKNQEQ